MDAKKETSLRLVYSRSHALNAPLNHLQAAAAK
jgi:hypothetical protein